MSPIQKIGVLFTVVGERIKQTRVNRNKKSRKKTWNMSLLKSMKFVHLLWHFYITIIISICNYHIFKSLFIQWYKPDFDTNVPYFTDHIWSPNIFIIVYFIIYIYTDTLAKSPLCPFNVQNRYYLSPQSTHPDVLKFDLRQMRPVVPPFTNTD